MLACRWGLPLWGDDGSGWTAVLGQPLASACGQGNIHGDDPVRSLRPDPLVALPLGSGPSSSCNDRCRRLWRARSIRASGIAAAPSQESP